MTLTRSGRHLLVVAALAAIVGNLGASPEQSNKCGNLEDPHQLLRDWYAPTFYDAQSAAWRAENGIQTLDPGTPGEVVTDQATCRRVMRAAMRVFRSWPDWREIQRLGYEFQVYRIGPYYAVHYSTLPPEGVLPLTYITNLQIFTADTLEYVGGMSYQG